MGCDVTSHGLWKYTEISIFKASRNFTLRQTTIIGNVNVDEEIVVVSNDNEPQEDGAVISNQNVVSEDTVESSPAPTKPKKKRGRFVVLNVGCILAWKIFINLVIPNKRLEIHFPSQFRFSLQFKSHVKELAEFGNKEQQKNSLVVILNPCLTVTNLYFILNVIRSIKIQTFHFFGTFSGIKSVSNSCMKVNHLFK